MERIQPIKPSQVGRVIHGQVSNEQNHVERKVLQFQDGSRQGLRIES